MKTYKSSPLSVIKWECLQLFFFFFFLFLLFLQEVSATRFLGVNNHQLLGIHRFLNELQSPLLPDFFFFLFFPLMLISVSLIIFKKWRWFFLAFSGAVISIFIIADKMYYTFFSSVITTASFSAAGQIWDVKSAVFEVLTLTDIFYIVSFGIFILFGIVYNQKMRMGLSESKLTFTIDKIVGILFCLLAIYCYNIAFYIPKRYVKITPDHIMRLSEKETHYDVMGYFIPNHEASDKVYAATFGITNFHIKNFTDAIKNQLKRKKYRNLPLPKHIYSFFDKKRVINKIKSPFYGIAEGRNVFLIHFESLNPILIGSYIGGIPVTPTLNTLEKKSLYWNYILDQVTIGGSSDAEFSSLTGMLPGTREISIFNTSCLPHLPSLPRALKSKGYQAISLHGYVSSFWNRNISQPLLGFETMYFKKSYTCTQKIGMGISDKEFFSQSIDLLQNHKTPFFAFMITLSSHVPYRGLPADYQQLFNQNIEPDSLLIRYLQAIRYSDDALGEFFSKIRASGLWENSIFVIYGDHRPGSNHKMNEALVKATGKLLTSPRFTCVPIMIVIPGREHLILEYKNQYKNTVGGLYDIFPTITHLLGYDVPFGVYGSHLFVKNSQRNPVPVFRFIGSFVFNGIHYQRQGGEISKDDMGLIFTNDADAVVKNKTESLKLYKETLQSISYCNYIYASSLDIESLQPEFDVK